MKKKTSRLPEALLALLSLIGLVGLFTFMAPCGMHDDGAWSSCHWAGQALKGLFCVMTAGALLACVLPASARAGAVLAMVPAAALAAVLPGTLISLCMMGSMRCNLIMKPAALVLGIIIAAAALAEGLRLLRRKEPAA